MEFVIYLLLAPIFKENGVIQIRQGVLIFGRHELDVSLSSRHVFDVFHVRALLKELQDPVISLLIRALLSHHEFWIPELHLDII